MQARCATSLQQITDQMQALDRKLPGLRQNLPALEAQKSAAAARESFAEAQAKKDQIATTLQEIEQAERTRPGLAERRTNVLRQLREADELVARRVAEREQAAEAERVRKAGAEEAARVRLAGEKRRKRHAELRRNPKSELHREMLSLANATGGLYDLENRAGEASRFLVEPRQLVFGQPVDAARGVEHYMNVSPQFVHSGMNDGINTMVREIDKLGSAVAKECFEYVLTKEAGSDPTTFQGGLKRDCDAAGNLLPSRRLSDGRGMMLPDFINLPIVMECALETPEVAGLRLYSTAAYEFINNPLPDQERRAKGEPHPLPITVAFIRSGLHKLKAVAAQSKQANQQARASLAATLCCADLNAHLLL